MPARPVFTRTDVMGSARTENVEGVTRYATAGVDAGGDVLRGSFERDGSRHGTFRMLRAGAVTVVKDRTQSERQREVMGIAADTESEEGEPSP
jgi:predicted secreted Zn-dependent protease